MAFIVGGARRSELEFQQSAAQLNTSLLVLAVIALVIPSAFAFALQATVGADAERGTILRMSRGSSVILIVIYVSYSACRALADHEKTRLTRYSGVSTLLA
jgi:Ca2+:H+ antiporter